MPSATTSAKGPAGKRPAASTVRVALDATPLSVPLAGIGRYTAELSRHLAEARPDAEVVLLSDQPFRAPQGPPNLRADPRPARGLERRWWSAGLPLRLRRMQATLFHGTDYAVPLLGSVPAVLTIHDLSPLRFPDWLPQSARRIARRLPRMAARARAVVVPSERVKEEVVETLRLPPAGVFVTPLAAAPCFRPQPRRTRVGSPYILFAGAIEPRKNLPGLLRAFTRLARPELRLVLAGPQAWGWQQVMATIAALGLQWQVTVAGQVSDPELAALYAGAALFVYPSLYEGFGLPVVEAMACGVPVVTSRDTAAADVAGDAALLVDPRSEDQIAEAMRRVLDDAELAENLRRRGLARAAEFSWKRTAELTWQVYESALSRS